MSEWKLNIPKTVHFFWDNRPLSFLRWLSINSFSTLNPDWEIKLHVTQDSVTPNWKQGNNKHEIQSDYRDWLEKINNIQIVEENLLPGLHGVYQSDILRNLYIYNDGGLWSDMDILYYRPMTSLFCNIDDNFCHSTGLCITRGWLPIAFMMGNKGSEFFKNVYDHQMDTLKNPPRRFDGYQKFGTKIYQHVAKHGGFPFFTINTTEVYQYQWRVCNLIFEGKINTSIGVGIHWYGGSNHAATAELDINHTTWSKHALASTIGITYEAV